jgi:integrase
MRFTQLNIDKTKPDPTKRIEMTEEGGLTLIVQPTGAKSWAIRYRHNGTSRKLTLGPYPRLGLADARKLAKKAYGDIALGGDPAAAKKREAVRASSPATNETTVQHVAEDFIRLHVSKLRPTTQLQFRGLLGREIIPRIGTKPITEITKRDIIEILDDLNDRPVTGNRLLSVTKRLFSWCIERDIITSSPLNGLKQPYSETARDRVLSDDELASVWRAAAKLGFPNGDFVRTLILTGQRRGEVAGMTWAEIDFDQASWTIPPERAKNGRANTVPLCPEAVAILKSVPRIYGNYVFGSGGLRGFSRLKIEMETLADIEERWVLHDVRRTVATGLARLGTPPHITESLLNHAVGTISAIGKIYNRYSYDAEKRAAIDAWCKHVVSL